MLARVVFEIFLSRMCRRLFDGFLFSVGISNSDSRCVRPCARVCVLALLCVYKAERVVEHGNIRAHVSA